MNDSINNSLDFDNVDRKYENINGGFITYKTGEVAELLNETPQMIRYYCKEFADFLGFKDLPPGEHRVYTQTEIEKLKYIIYLLKEKDFTVRHAKEFLATPEGILMVPVETDEEKAEKFVQLVTSKIKTEMDVMLTSYVNQIVNQVKIQLSEPLQKAALDTIESQKKLEQEVKEMLSKSIEETQKVNQKLTTLEERTQEINNMTSTLSKVDTFIQEFRQKQNNPQKQKGIFGFLFSKDKK